MEKTVTHSHKIYEHRIYIIDEMHDGEKIEVSNPTSTEATPSHMSNWKKFYTR